VASLAAFLCPGIAMNLPLMQMQARLAEEIIMQARTADGNEGSNCQDHVPDWISARNGGSGGWDVWQGVGYDNINWGFSLC